jgi:hypothetical protein
MHDACVRSTFAHTARKALRFQFYLPDASRMSESRKLVSAALAIINIASTFKLSAKVRAGLSVGAMKLLGFGY